MTPATWPGTAADLWRSVGMELIIFVITLVFALVISITGRKDSLAGKRKKAAVNEVPATKQPSYSGTDAPRAAGGGFTDRKASKLAAGAGDVVRQRSVTNQAMVASRAMTALASRHRSDDARQPRTIPQLVNEIVDGVREQQSMKFASRTLGLYAELRASLAAGQPSIAEAAKSSRHPVIEVYTTVVQCAVRVGRFELVDVVIKDMIHQRVERPLAFYEIAMKQLAGQKQYRLALQVYDRLEADGLEPSVVTCSCLIGFAAEVGEFQRAVDFFHMLATMTTPSIRAYMTVLRVHAKRQDWPASLSTFRHMQARGVRPDSLVLNFVLATGIAADQVEAASALVEELAGEAPAVPDVVSYNTLVKGHAQRADSDGAMQALGRMRRRGLVPNSITFNTAMDAAVRGGKCHEAWELLTSMRGTGLRPDKFTSSILVKGLAKGATAVHVRSALELLSEVGGVCDLNLLSTLYHSVLEASASLADAELAARAFSQMRRSHVVPTAAAQRLLVQVLPQSETKSIAAELAKVMA